MNFLNGSKLFAALTLLTVNFGAKYVVGTVPEDYQALLETSAAQRVILFAIFFMSTRDLPFSAAMTLACVVVYHAFLCRASPYCVLGVVGVRDGFRDGGRRDSVDDEGDGWTGGAERGGTGFVDSSLHVSGIESEPAE